MPQIKALLQNNRDWSAKQIAREPDFFTELAKQQAPEYLWIGCSDSRVPANQIVGLMPGEVFVHRNIANQVVHTDLNCLSVMQFSVDVLKVKHILVVGHYGCGGVYAALTNRRMGLVDNWIRHIQDVRQKHAEILEQHAEEKQRADCLCELNVIEQVANVCQTTVIQEAWQRGQEIAIHGWCYALHDGIIRNLGVDVAKPEDVAPGYEAALARVRSGILV